MPETVVIPFRSGREKAPGPELRDLFLSREGVVLLDGLSVRFAPEGVTALLGPNGAGKSLTLRVMAGLLAPDRGHVTLPPVMTGRVGLVFQRPVLLRRSVAGNLRHAMRLARVPRKERAERMSALLEMGQLEHLADRAARRLSGGEQQRLAMVRALASNPMLLMLDEPTAHLDPQATAAIEALVRRIVKGGTKVILVTHDAGQVTRIADEVAFMHQGRCLEVTQAEAFMTRPKTVAAQDYLTGELLL